MFVFLSQTFWDFPALARRTQRAQLVTISYSHFVEGARWCLDASGVAYDEAGYAPGQHILPVISVRVPKGGKPVFASSSNVSGNKSKPSPTSVPVMVSPSGKVFEDSWAIAESCTGLKQIDQGDSLKTMLDEELGPAVRSLAYCYLFKPAILPHFAKMCTEGRHWLFRLVWFCGFGSYLIKRMAGLFKTNDPATLQNCIDQTQAALDKIAQLLATKKSKYLSGPELGVADIFAASLIAVVVNPPEYGGRDSSLVRHTAEQERLDPEYAAHIRKWREHPAGQYCLEIYKAHRMTGIGK